MREVDTAETADSHGPMRDAGAQPLAYKTNKSHTQKKWGERGGKTGSGHLSLMATEGGCASTRGHSANLECSFEVREGQIWALNRKVKGAT